MRIHSPTDTLMRSAFPIRRRDNSVRRQWILRTLLLFVGSGVVVAQEPIRKDTATYRLREVTAESARPVVPAVLGHTRSAELHDSDLVRMQTRQSAEILRYMPGVFVRDYGGLAGIKTVSLRGAAASQTAVYLDGVRLNGTQNGLFDFSTFTSSFLRSVIVTDAVDATLSGAHAMGGIVMMTSKSPDDSSLRASVTADAGSWGERGIATRVSMPAGHGMVVAADADLRRAHGDYPFAFSNFGTTSEFRRTNADYTSANGMLTVSTHDSSWRSTTRVILRSSRRGAPDAVTQGNIGTSTARLDDDAALLMHNGIAQLSATTELRWQAFGNFQTQQYADTSSSLLGVPFRNRFVSRDVGGAVSVHHATAMRDEAAVRVDATVSEVRGDLLRFGAGDRALRTSIGIGAGAQSRPLLTTPSMSVFLLGGVRVDANSDAAPFWTPRASVLVRLADGVDISAHAARAFRLPSFNELYYQNYGSTSLTPEQATMVRLTAEYAFPLVAATQTTMSATVFHRETKDQIVAIPRSPVTWSAMNIASVRSRGCEVGLVSRLSSMLLLRAGVTLQDVRDRTSGSRNFDRLVPYTPQTLGYAQVMASSGPLSGGAGLNSCGERFTQTDNARASALSPYTTVHVFAAYQWSMAGGMGSVRAECDNLLGADYVIVANYPMPGRMFRMSVGWTF